MIKCATAVVGAGFGDEGKGLLTDYFAVQDGLVVRFNSGAQAGHTVQLPDGRRHVFHHFGAGSFKKTATHLSRFFVSNPLLLQEERAVFRDLGGEVDISADPSGLVSTHFDMFINQIVEESRGDLRHGSCGVGLNETIKRHESGLKLTVGMRHDLYKVTGILHDIRKDWLPERLHALGVTTVSEKWRQRIANTQIDDAFLQAFGDFNASLIPDNAHLSGYGEETRYGIVFEGAQGLLLDEKHRFFPHVTHSRTGLTNVLAICQSAGINFLDVIYVTRAYATRHGRGPFPHEQADLRYEDRTNVANEWQETLRFGHLDLDLLAEAITNDQRVLATLAQGMTIVPRLAVTCLDQIGPVNTYIARGITRVGTHEDFLADLTAMTGVKVKYISHGPTREDVTNLLPDERAPCY